MRSIKFQTLLLFLSIALIPLLATTAADIPYDANDQLHGKIIIEVGLPKSGTTSLYDGLLNINIKASHYFVKHTLCENTYPIPEARVSTNNITTVWKEINSADGCYAGMFIQKAIAQGLKPLHYFTSSDDPHYQAFMQIDACRPPPYDFCVMPQVFALDQLTDAYPDAMYIMTRRSSSTVHATSMSHWANMIQRYKHFGYLHLFKGQSENKTDLENEVIMIDEIEKLQVEYFAKKPHIKFLDICVEHHNASAIIAEFLGIPSFPILHSNKGVYHNNNGAPAAHRKKY